MELVEGATAPEAIGPVGAPREMTEPKSGHESAPAETVLAAAQVGSAKAKERLGRVIALVRPAAPATAASMQEMAEVAYVERSAPEAVRGWASVDLVEVFAPDQLARAVVEQGTRRLAWWVGLAEFVRNFLVLVPVTLTWIGLGKAAAVYATCAPAAREVDLGKVPFLQLWQRGFQNLSSLGVRCDPTAGTTYGLPLGSFGEIVTFDFVVLASVIGLTIFVHAFTNLRSSGDSQRMRELSDEIRAVLNACAIRLQQNWAQFDTAEVVLKASENLKDVADRFRQEAERLMVQSSGDVAHLALEASQNLTVVASKFREDANAMMGTLQERSVDAERRLSDLGSRSAEIAEKALGAGDHLQATLSTVSATAEQLSDLSLRIKADVAASADTMRSSVTTAQTQLAALGGQLAGVATAITGVDLAIKRLVQGASDSDEVRRDTRDAVRSMSDRLLKLDEIERQIRQLRMENAKERGPASFFGIGSANQGGEAAPARMNVPVVLQAAQVGVLGLLLVVGLYAILRPSPTAGDVADPASPLPTRTFAATAPVFRLPSAPGQTSTTEVLPLPGHPR